MSVPRIDTSDYLTCGEAADELDLSADSIRKYCNNWRDGKTPALEAIHLGRDWFIHRHEIERYKRERCDRGRPAVKL